jgi:Family of unknown function (DUF5681)
VHGASQSIAVNINSHSIRDGIMSEDDKACSVGYGRPPKHSQFSKGASGNPTGRPRAVPSLRSDLAAELQQPHEIFENGAPIRVTKLKAVLRSLTAKAIDNDTRAASVLFALIRQYGVGTDEPAPEIDIDDLDELEAYAANERKRLSQLDPSAMPSPDPDTNSTPNNEDKRS